jgi:stage V sporulation protein D (sporulation-specific penicillin-binding protein)
MFQAFQYRRLALFGVILLLAFAAVEYRLYYLQVVRYQELTRKSQPYFEVRRTTQPVRGEIRDCHDRPLAITRPVKNVFLDPAQLGDRTNEMAKVLASWLNTDPARLSTSKLGLRLLGHSANGAPFYDNKVCLKLGVTLGDWERLKQSLEAQTFGFDLAKLHGRQKVQLNRLRKHAVFAEDDQLRIYPQDRLACHLLGRLEHDPRTGVFVPRWGLEQTLDTALCGKAGYCESVRDVTGAEIPNRRAVFREPVAGQNVVLTIDSVLQDITARELKAGMDLYQAQGAVAVMVRVKTGEILALVSLPDYGLAENETVPQQAWRNRAIQDLIEPGSTIKIVTYSAALNEGAITWERIVDCQDSRNIPRGGHLSDHERLGRVPYWQAFQKSSNIAGAQVGLGLGAELLNRYLSAFGFSAPTGLGFKEERFSPVPADSCSATAVSRRSIGYGVAVTPMQLVMAMSALANDGRLMKPMLVARVVDDRGQVLRNNVPQCVRQVVTPTTARQMVLGLKKVVAKEGTGCLAALDNYTVAGKTGTARVAGNHGYLPGKYRSTFAGFFPADAPEVCLLVLFDQPVPLYFGGQTAAPVFHKIAEQTALYLDLSPEIKPLQLAGLVRVATSAPTD